MNDQYEQRQRQLEDEYERAYMAWYEALSDRDREKLNSAQVSPSAEMSGPYLHKRYSGKHEESTESERLEDAKFGFSEDALEAADKFPDYLAELGVQPEVASRIATLFVLMVERRVKWEQARILRHVIAGFLGSGNTRINAYALCYAAGLDELNNLPKTLRKAARLIGCTHAAISKVAVAWRERLGLPENAFSKSPKARESYRTAQLRSGWRKQSFKPA